MHTWIASWHAQHQERVWCMLTDWLTKGVGELAAKPFFLETSHELPAHY